MDIIHKLNPFHPRPSSALRKHADTPSLEHHHTHGLHPPQHTHAVTRGSASLDSGNPHPLSGGIEGTYTNDRRTGMVTPIPLIPPPPPSLGKNHHSRTPSILRTLAHHPSLSALKNRSKSRREGKKARPPLPMPSGSGPEVLAGGSVGKLRKGEGLRGSKSIPKGLRLSGEYIPRPSESSPLPSCPITPTAYLYSPSPPSQGHPSSFPRTNSPLAPIRRKPAPIADVTFHSPSGLATPDSVRVRRMKFSLELESSSSPSPPRRRGGSSPARPEASPRRGSLLTRQHPHPIPLETPSWGHPAWHDPSWADEAEGGADQVVKGRDPRDFIPLTESGRTMESWEVGEEGHAAGERDGLNVLKVEEDMPVGTPGGRWGDLSRGILVDGAKHEKGAIRFFSRDMYAPRSTSPTPSPEHSPCPTPQTDPSSGSDATSMPTREEFKKHAKRSSSPFEVKLAPHIAKRISLDAFGTPALETLDPARTVAERDDGTAEEVLLEEGEPEVEGHESSRPSDGDSGESDGKLDEWTTRELSTIEEGVSAERSREQEGRSVEMGPSQQQHEEEGSKTRYYTPISSDKRWGTEGGLPRAQSSPWIPRRKHMSAPPLEVTRTLLAAHEGERRALREEVCSLKGVVESLERRLKDEKDRDERGAERSDEQTEEARSDVASLIARKEAALIQARQALQAAQHPTDMPRVLKSLRIQLKGLEQRNAELEVQVKADEIAAFKLEDELAAERGRAEQAERERQQEIALRKGLEEQLVVTTEEYTEALKTHEAEVFRLQKTLLAEKAAVYRLEGRVHEREEEVTRYKEQAKMREEEVRQLLGEKRSWKREVADKEREVQQLRERLQVERFEKDELSVRARKTDRQYEELRAEKEGVENDLKEQVDDLMRRNEELEEEAKERELSMREVRNEMANLKEEAFEDREELLEQLQLHEAEVDDRAQLQEQLSMRQAELETATTAMERMRETLESKDAMLRLHEGELAYLRSAVGDAEDLHARSIDAGERALRESTKRREGLQQEISELRAQLGQQQDDLTQAVVERETAKAHAADVSSRLGSYLAEIDRLTLACANLQAEIGDLRKASADDELRRVELRRNVEMLEQDRELLNVALESKGHEVTLLQRQLGVGGRGSVTPTKKRLVASTSRVPPPATPTTHHGPTPRLASSTSGGGGGSTLRRSTSNAARRESTTLGASVGMGLVTPRQAGTRIALGGTTRHNRTPERVMRTVVVGSGGERGLKTKSSLQVLVRRPSSVCLRERVEGIPEGERE